MKLEFITIAFSLVALTSCSSDDPPVPSDPGGSDVEENITLTLEKDNIEISVGQSVALAYEVSPEDTPIEWLSSDTRIATVDESGIVTAVARGSATITAMAEGVKAQCVVKVVRAVAVGDYYYSDGTFSTNPNSGKTMIGVVFWIGDPTKDDAALRADHPECTHGLVVALNHIPTVPWQSNFGTFDSTVGAWIDANTDYTDISSSWGLDVRRNSIAGYNNTKAIEAFNAASSNASWQVEAVQAAVEFRSQVPAPDGTSDWFLPGIKELTLLVNSEHDGDVFDFNNIARDKACLNKAVINASLSAVDGADMIGINSWAYDFWGSTEWMVTQSYHVSSLTGMVMGGSKDDYQNQVVRCVLAF